MLKKILIVAGIIALGFLARWASAEDVWKVQSVIKLDSRAEVVQAYLNDDNTNMEGINLTKVNKELSVVSRDDKVLTVDMFYDSLAKATVIYYYLVSQASDMIDIESEMGVSKSQVKLLQTTNGKNMSQRRKRDTKLNSYTKE